MNPTIAIYFSDSEPLGYPLNKQEYLESYAELAQAIQSHGIDVRIVRGESYEGKGVFSHGWILHADHAMERVDHIQANLIFNRDDKNTIPRITDCPIINHPDLDALCTDKVKTAETFADISPLTAAISSFEEVAEKLNEWHMQESDMIVFKKNFETEGRDIFILPVSDAKESLYASWENVLIQEFLDSSGGIPGLTDKKHDLRLTVVNGKPSNAYLRIPPAGSYIANVSLGGSGQALELSAVSEEVMGMTQRIIDYCAQYSPYLIAADFIHSPKGYKLIELNSRPGLQHKHWSANYKDFNDAVAEMLVKAATHT